MSPLSPESLSLALKKTLGQDRFVDKLKWWLQFAPSTERWLQFELGYQLQLVLGDAYIVGLEQKQVDIAVYTSEGAALPVWQNLPIGKVELKVMGNWYTIGSTYSDLRADVEKVDRYGNTPAAALAVWFFVRPKAEDARYNWILLKNDNEVKRGVGVEGSDTILARTSTACGCNFRQLCRIPLTFHDFDVCEVVLLGYFNRAASLI